LGFVVFASGNLPQKARFRESQRQVGNRKKEKHMTDHIADLLVRIRNASMVRKYEVSLPFSKMKEAILRILEREEFVKNVEVFEEEKSAKDETAHKSGKKLIRFRISNTKTPTHVKQISKPGQRIYVKSKDIPNPLRGLGLVIISTPKGVITAKEASKTGLGGELICEIW